jgi:GTP:adenosylcobinamide-phosphate guanylyltransferase
VLDALTESKSFSRIIGVVSPNSPATEKYLQSVGVEILAGAGAGFSSDLSHVLEKCRPDKVFAVPADLALLDATLVKKILAHATDSHPAVSAVSHLDFVYKLGIKPSVIVDVNNTRCSHSGITIFDTGKINRDQIASEKYVIINEPGVAVNVNTKEELGIAEKLIHRA